jgi:hypothetical protein
VSDYVVEPGTDIELVNGELRVAAHAGPLHSRQLNLVSYVLCAYVARGHGVDIDLLTRQDAENNFSGDISIRKDGIDPDTDDRYLEELVFEVRHTLDPDDLAYRARIMAACGVRRIFAVPVHGDAGDSESIGRAGPVTEWMPAEERWCACRDDDVITDPCLFQPLPVHALLDPAAADDAVVRALLARGNRVVLAYLAERYRAGEEMGEKKRAMQAVRRSIQLLLRDRGIAVDADTRARIAACRDQTMLERWLMRAPYATSASELFDGD